MLRQHYFTVTSEQIAILCYFMYLSLFSAINTFLSYSGIIHNCLRHFFNFYLSFVTIVFCFGEQNT